MQFTTKNLVRSFLSGLLLMGVTIAGVPQAGATATGFGAIVGQLNLEYVDGVEASATGGHDFQFSHVDGNGTINRVDSCGGVVDCAPEGLGPIDVGAISDVSADPVGHALGLAVGIANFYLENTNNYSVYLPGSVLYQWEISGTTMNPGDFSAAGVALFLVLSDILPDWNSITTDLMDNEMDMNSLPFEIIPLIKEFNIAPLDFFAADSNFLASGLSLDPNSGINVSLVAVAGSVAKAVPEPTTMVLLGSGLVGLVAWRMRKQTV